ncbi:F-box/RNI-like superfamily protein [Striga asiatica]|uniref:F-box/RNI-like superfamily protein n=1 Tax=Striga asiatica TaxID=4170 RepID=A0A5A7P4W3_STRAF|nr:F-box/RNI-like superfamily protein [Striga asiatica]
MKNPTSTRPNLKLLEECFEGSKQQFLSFVDTTLQGYHDQNLCIQELVLRISTSDPDSVLLLEKWIPAAVQILGVRKLNLTCKSALFDLPPHVFQSGPITFLTELYLESCRLSRISSTAKVQPLKHLQRLSLKRVRFTDETLDNITLSCPMIDHLSLDECEGLGDNIRVNKLSKLKEFTFKELRRKAGRPEIEIDAPRAETIKIWGFSSWSHHSKSFPNLKSLHLFRVHLSESSFEAFSCGLPCLVLLNLILCHGLEEFQLSSRSIKELVIKVAGPIRAARVDAPNMSSFRFSSNFVPAISFSTGSGREWESRVVLASPCVDFRYRDPWPWFLKLHEFLRALSRSRVSLSIEEFPVVGPGGDCGGFVAPVAIESLSVLGGSCYSIQGFLNCLFRVVRPRNVVQPWIAGGAEGDWTIREGNRLTEFMGRSLACRKLVDVSMEAWDERGNGWSQVGGRSEGFELPINGGNWKIRFRLKWREMSYLHRLLII